MGCKQSSVVEDYELELTDFNKLIGCRLEAKDRANPELLCVATISIKNNAFFL
jgi:hypothetical protein